MTEQVERFLSEYSAGLERAAERDPSGYLRRRGGGRAVAIFVLDLIRSGKGVNVSAVMRRAAKKAELSVNRADLPALREALLVKWPAGTVIS